MQHTRNGQQMPTEVAEGRAHSAVRRLGHISVVDAEVRPGCQTDALAVACVLATVSCASMSRFDRERGAHVTEALVPLQLVARWLNDARLSQAAPALASSYEMAEAYDCGHLMVAVVHTDSWLRRSSPAAAGVD